MAEKILTMVLCGGRGERLYPLTKDRAKPAVPFLGSYRIIDFSLSNATNSGFRRIALLMQYKSLSLERHILNGWNIFNTETGEFILSLPAQGRVGDRWYEGTADAVFQNIYTIQEENPSRVLVLSGDHIYKTDYRKVLKFALDRKAEAVVMAKLSPTAQASRFGILGVDESGRILNFQEKPRNPAPSPWHPDMSLVSMGVYLFETRSLIKALIRDAKNKASAHDFGKNVLPEMIGRAAVYAYVFDDYWEDIGTLDAYWEAHRLFLSTEPPFLMNDPAWPIRTYKPQYPASMIAGGKIAGSVVASGCRIYGGTIQDSLLSEGVTIEDNAEIRDSVILEGATVGRNARIRKTVIDKGAIIPEGFAVGYDDDADRRYFKISREGLRVIPKNWNLE